MANRKQRNGSQIFENGKYRTRTKEERKENRLADMMKRKKGFKTGT